jgi:hypothetical protein
VIVHCVLASRRHVNKSIGGVEAKLQVFLFSILEGLHEHVKGKNDNR